ncbi:MAG: type IIL restriction-modification enzyme MmeI [Acetobacteraceae bacterium]
MVEGAAVRVSLVCFAREAKPPFRLDGRAVPRINPDLTSAKADLTTARPLAENHGVGFMGTVKGGKFEVAGEVARRWLLEPANANARPNADVLRPWVNTLDVVRRPLDRWIVDFGVNMSEAEAAFFARPFAHVRTQVWPHRQTVRNRAEVERWWIYSRSLPSLRAALAPLVRYIATPTVSKHRVFVWLDGRIQPDHQLVAIARDDGTTFGILHSRFHEAWALRLGTSLEDRPRYTPTTTFETFPFPEGLTPNLPAASFASDPRAIAIAEAARALVEARDRWLNPPDLVERVPEVVPGFPDRLLPRNEAAAKALKGRTLTNLYNTRGTPEGAWLDALHRRLDEAAAAAYGWPPDISEQDALAALLALNHARPAAKTGRTDEEP